MKYLFCILLGYLIGSLSPSALISKLKHKDVRKHGTGNLGATNVSLTFGRKFGFLVMIFDILKGFFAVKLAQWIVPDMAWFAMVTGFFAVIGHCFPFYLKFKGGKGLAAFGGVILAYQPLLFLFILISGVAIVLISNIGTTMSLYTPTAFAIYVLATNRDIPTVIVCVAMSLFLWIIFIPNLIKVIRGQEMKSNEFLGRNSGTHEKKGETWK